MQIVSHRLESAEKGLNPHVLTNDESERLAHFNFISVSSINIKRNAA